MEVFTLFGSITKDCNDKEHEGGSEFWVDAAVYDAYGIVHDLSQSAVLVLAESIEELSCISSKRGEWLNLIFILIFITSELDFYVFFDDMDEGVDKLLWIIVVVLVVIRSEH